MLCGLYVSTGVKPMKIRKYDELVRLPTFIERYRYLVLPTEDSDSTIMFDRWMKQDFYLSKEWRAVRNQVIARDRGCDLGISGYELLDSPMVHHMNPISYEFFSDDSLQQYLLDPNFLITVSRNTHTALHYGKTEPDPILPIVRRPNDQAPWLCSK